MKTEKADLREIALLDDVCALPAQMQKVYLQLVSAIDASLQKLRSSGARPVQLSEEFIEEIINLLLDGDLTQQSLQKRVDDEFHRGILGELEPDELAPVC